MDKTNHVSRQQLKDALIGLGVGAGMVLEVHSSLSSFGHLEGLIPVRAGIRSVPRVGESTGKRPSGAD